MTATQDHKKKQIYKFKTSVRKLGGIRGSVGKAQAHTSEEAYACKNSYKYLSENSLGATTSLQGSTDKRQAPKKLQLKVTTTFSIKFWGLPFKVTQMNPAHKVQTKKTSRHKSKVPATLAHRSQIQTKMPQKP